MAEQQKLGYVELSLPLYKGISGKIAAIFRLVLLADYATTNLQPPTPAKPKK